MRVMILGGDGYIGWPLTLHLITEGHHVFSVDNLSRRALVAGEKSDSVTPITSYGQRGLEAMMYAEERLLTFERAQFDVCDYRKLGQTLRGFGPDAIVHLAENPSAPWSMKDVDHAWESQILNINSTLSLLWAMKKYAPNAHLIKLGSMGEYGTPDIPITENVSMPKQPGSFYHASKVADSVNVEMCCRIWGLNATDIMQGIVFGATTEEITGDDPAWLTRFDIDECFGTVANRFCAQYAVGYPLTVYGTGKHKRSFLPLRDSLQCIRLLIENPANGYRVVNQFAEVWSIENLAKEIGKDIQKIDNPRIERAEHGYAPESNILKQLGYEPTQIRHEIRRTMNVLGKYEERIAKLKHVFAPSINWR